MRGKPSIQHLLNLQRTPLYLLADHSTQDLVKAISLSKHRLKLAFKLTFCSTNTITCALVVCSAIWTLEFVLLCWMIEKEKSSENKKTSIVFYKYKNTYKTALERKRSLWKSAILTLLVTPDLDLYNLQQNCSHISSFLLLNSTKIFLKILFQQTFGYPSDEETHRRTK